MKKIFTFVCIIILLLNGCTLGNNSKLTISEREIRCYRETASNSLNISMLTGSKNKLFTTISSNGNSILLFDNNEKTVVRINENLILENVQSEKNSSSQLLFCEFSGKKYYLGGDGEYYGERTFLCYENNVQIEKDFVIKWGSFQLPWILLHEDRTDSYVLFNMETEVKLRFEHDDLKLKIYNVAKGFVVKYTEVENPWIDQYEKHNSSMDSEFKVLYPENTQKIVTQKNSNKVFWLSLSGDIFIQKLLK